MDSSLLFQYITITWLVLGAILLFIEVSFIPSIGFLFAGLAAITVGGLLTFDLISPNDHLFQLSLFLIFTCLWAAILWLPMKKLRAFGTKAPVYQDMIGDTVIIEESDLEKGKVGRVKWSGTIMNARLHPHVNVEKVSVGNEMVIAQVRGNMLIVKEK